MGLDARFEVAESPYGRSEGHVLCGRSRCLLPLVALFQRRLRFLWLLYYGWGKPAKEAALNLPSGGVRRLLSFGKAGESSVFTRASSLNQQAHKTVS